jgi:hypothetical protein
MTGPALIFAAVIGQSDPAAELKLQVVVLTNRERKRGGLGPLAISPSLEACAQDHARDMAARGYFSHTTPEGRRFWERAEAAGYLGQPRAENIHQGRRTATEIMRSWMNSPGHKANILLADANEIGIGYDSSRSMAVMVLGRGANPQPPPDDIPIFNPTEPVRIVFPMLGKTKWSDTYLAPRPGGRQHMGQDLPAEKMRPLLACFDGRWWGGGITRQDGVSAAYIHLNNDTPGTDDGRAVPLDTYAPGVWPGVEVKEGQIVAYNGDSGNAEETIPHLHFELILPGIGNINPAASLRAARVVAEPVHVPEHPELLPQEGQVRWDGEVREVDLERRVLVVDLAGTVDPAGTAKGVKRQTRRFIKLGSLEVLPKMGDYLAVLGPEPGPGKAMEASGLMVFRSRPL